jgi:PAS domain S-box-containing protein
VTGGDELKVLFVEDLPSDAELAERALLGGGLVLESRRVETREAFLDALGSFGPDIVISDYSMPSFDGMSALKLARAGDSLLPFIILTGSMNEDTAVECMKAGASDYVIKEHITRLPFAVKEAIARRGLAIEAVRKSEQLLQSEERYHALFENSHAVKMILDPEDMVVVEANQAACVFYGWSKDAMVGKRITEYNVGDEGEIRRNFERALGGKARHFLLKHRKCDGTVVDVEVYSGPILLGGKTRVFSIVHDVSDRIAAERQRDELSSKLDHYLTTSPAITYSLRIRDGKAVWQWVSENISVILGYSVAEVLEPDWWLHNVYAADRMRVLAGVTKVVASGTFGQEYRLHKKDRSVVWIHDEMRFVQSDRGETEIIGTLTDISDRKKVESELSLKSLALDAAANAIVITDREGTIRWANAAFERLTGYSMTESVGENPRSLLKSGEQDAAFYRGLWATILSGQVWQGELVNRRKDASTYVEEMTITPVLDESRVITGFIAIKSDVTERKLNLERIEASLSEKEVLLREIHHRINNNMQLIISLLSLSSQEIADPSLGGLLSGVSQRLVSMALVHEQFYTSPDLARIDFILYLHQLTDGLYSDYQRFFGKVAVVSSADSVLLNLEQAIPAGLAASELIVNAMRFAYPGEAPPGEVRIMVRRFGPNLEITVRDEGVGLPEGFAPGGAESLGMILVHTLAAQLHGKVEFRSFKGTEASLSFPIE